MARETPNDPRWEPIRAALGRLCRNGVERYWVRDEGGPLLELQCVKDRARKAGSAAGRPEALVEILREIVSGIRDTQHGKILWIVLALDGTYLGDTATSRRAIAGETFRDGRRQVTPGTIRQYHEPRALDRLAALLLAYEDRHVEAAARAAANADGGVAAT
jgi:hypothetical protein